MLTLWVPLFNTRMWQIRETAFHDYIHANDCSKWRAGKNLAQDSCSLASGPIQCTDDIWTRICILELVEPPSSQRCTVNSLVIPSPFGSWYPRWDLLRSRFTLSRCFMLVCCLGFKSITPACSSSLSTLHIDTQDVFLQLNKVPVRSEVSCWRNFKKLQHYLYCQTVVIAVSSFGLMTIYLQMIMEFEGRKKIIIAARPSTHLPQKILLLLQAVE